MPPGLKITSHTNQILFNSAWTEGVDYKEDCLDGDFKMESEDEEYNEENEEDKYHEMDKNELAKIIVKPHPHYVLNENNNIHHDNNDPKDS